MADNTDNTTQKPAGAGGETGAAKKAAEAVEKAAAADSAASAAGGGKPSEGAGKAPAGGETEEKKKRSTVKLFLGSLCVMASFVIGSIVILLTDYEGKYLSGLVYTVGILFALYMVFVIPPNDEEKERRESKKEEKQKKRSKSKKAKVFGVIGDSVKIVALVCALALGLVAIIFSNTLGDVIAIAFMFTGMIIYFVTFANID